MTSINLPNTLGCPATSATFEARGLVLAGWLEGERREMVLTYNDIARYRREADGQMELWEVGDE